MAGLFDNNQLNFTNQLDLSSLGNYGSAYTPDASLAALGTTPVGGTATQPTNWWDSFSKLLLGGKDATTGATQSGIAMPAIAAGSALLQGFLGMQQYGLAKDQFKESKRQYEQNYNAQKTTTNAALEDRQRARVASNSGAYESVSDYMNKNRIV